MALISPFIIVLTLVVVLLARHVQAVISFFTVAKSVLLLFMIAVVGVVAEDVSLQPSDEWAAML